MASPRRRAHIVVGVLGLVLVVYGLAVALDARPVGRDGITHCGNALVDGPDSATTLCGMHQFLGRLVGGGSLAVGAGLLVWAVWRQRRLRRGQHELDDAGDPPPATALERRHG
jgi:hypothetical protein